MHRQVSGVPYGLQLFIIVIRKNFVLGYIFKTVVAYPPLLAKSTAVSFPIPVLAPVIIIVLPSSLASDDHWPYNRALKEDH